MDILKVNVKFENEDVQQLYLNYCNEKGVDPNNIINVTGFEQKLNSCNYKIYNCNGYKTPEMLIVELITKEIKQLLNGLSEEKQQRLFYLIDTDKMKREFKENHFIVRSGDFWYIFDK